MITVQKDNIFDAWKYTRSLVEKVGYRIHDGDEELMELINLFIAIKNPDDEDYDIIKQDPEMYAWMQSNFNEIKKIPELGDSWSYGWRLYKYMDEVNQIEYITNKLKKKPESKSATITTLIKPGVEPYVPCVSLLDFKLRDETLTLTATCRSIDIGKKGLYNMVELARILNTVAGYLDVKSTRLVMHIISAHIYMKDLGGEEE